ncbi:hypothetical protein [Nocardioides sp.]|uniref:hypothetical protein n=1 Tax=Nocardioides sp. TaxID=35761 RepID=UPI0039E50216
MSRPTDEQIGEQYDAAMDSAASGSKWPNMSYEQGVASALAWVTGDDDTPPMLDEDDD